VASSTKYRVVWLQKLLSRLFGLKLEANYIWCDNQSCMKLSENLVFHDRSKHIEIKYHYIRDMVQRGGVRVQYVTTKEQVADVLTKPLLRTKFEHFKDKLGVVPLQRE
jgi:ATP sulfurylase